MIREEFIMQRIMKKNIILSKVNNYIYDSLLPINLNYWYNIGSLLGFFIISQILTGLLLSTNYIGTISLSFESIEVLMREVKYGYILRYLHSNGSAIIFLLVYLHIGRGLLYGSYTKLRMGTWYTGIILLFALILTSFLGYSLVGGQMSYWAIKVISNLLTVIPYIGEDIVEWIYGGYNIGDITLMRFYTLHYILPIVIVGIIMIHLIVLHNKGGSNPLGINSVRSLSLINFHPYYTIKDTLSFIILYLFLLYLVFFDPNLLSHSDNYIRSNPLVTPTHIVPEIYLLYYYMGLRSIPNKLGGVLILLTIILVLFLLPFLHKGIISSFKFRPIIKFGWFFFFLNFICGTYLGALEVVEPYITLSRISVIYYLFFILIFIPIISLIETIVFIYNSKIKL